MKKLSRKQKKQAQRLYTQKKQPEHIRGCLSDNNTKHHVAETSDVVDLPIIHSRPEDDAGSPKWQLYRTKLTPLLFPFILIILTATIYSNTLQVPFVLDDRIAIVEHHKIQITELGSLNLKDFLLTGRPLAYLSFAANYYFHQFNTTGYHLVNISIHLLTGFFLFLFIRTTFTLPTLINRYNHPDLISYGAVLLWIAHPLHTSSVTYIVQRMASMATMFIVLSCFLYVKARLSDRKGRRNTYFICGLLSWFMALGCKQIAVPLPFFILLYEWYFFQSLNRRWLQRHLLFIIAPFLAFILLTFVILGPTPWLSYWHGFDKWPFTPYQRFLTEFRVVIHYISLLLYPHPGRLNLDYNFPLSYSPLNPLTTIFSICAVGLIAWLAVLLARRHPLISFSIWWFLGSLLLELIWPTSIIMEYKTYLPSVLFFLPFSILFFEGITNRTISKCVIIILLVPLGLWTYERNKVWKDNLTLWTDCVQKSPDKWRTNNNLGRAYFWKWEFDRAIEYYSKALRIEPTNEITMENLAAAYNMTRQYQKSIAMLNRLLRQNPGHPKARSMLATAARQAMLQGEKKK